MSLDSWLDQGRKPLTQTSDTTTKRLLAACASGEPLRIHYAKPSQAEERSITVREVFTVRGDPYIEAFCHMRQALRRFMISRITILDGVSSPVGHRLGAVVGPIPCEVEVVDLDGDYGSVEGVEATCSRCGHVTESFGTGSASIRRCLALMRDECPLDESNYYIES